MAKEDFCFTYYDGDAARDMAHMNRLERGGYVDLIVSQRKFGHLPLSLIKKTLGSDFENIWGAIKIVLQEDSEGNFFVEWVETSLQKMRRQSVKQHENGKKGGRPKANKNPNHNPDETQLQTQTITQKKPLGDGDGNEDELKTEDGGELHFQDFKKTLINVVYSVSAEKATNAQDFHNAIHIGLLKQGYKSEKEFVVPEGRIDIVVHLENEKVAIELDNRMPRGKSILKMNNSGFRTVSILRDPNLEFDYTDFQSVFDILILYPQPKYEGRGIVPEMAKQFTDKNPNYYFEKDSDYANIREIGTKIFHWLKLPGQAYDTSNNDPIRQRWGEVITHVKADTHLSKYSLSQINKHFSSITQSFSNGRSQPHQQLPAPKKGTSEARTDALKGFGLASGEQVP